MQVLYVPSRSTILTGEMLGSPACARPELAAGMESWTKKLSTVSASSSSIMSMVRGMGPWFPAENVKVIEVGV